MDRLGQIQSKIYEIRGQRVMLDFDLAGLYQVETKALNRAVKRNIERFPERYMFQLSKDEFDNLRCQIGTSSTHGGTRYLPYVFTEQGVSMLSAVLRSPIAIQVSISIMDAFVAMRQLILNPPIDRLTQLQQEVFKLKEYVEEVFTDYNDINEDTRMQLELINETLAELQIQRKPSGSRRAIGFKKE